MKTNPNKLPYAVRNWKDFQHYKNRTPPWVKLHRTLLDDIDYFNCEASSAKYLPLVWLIASENDGRLPGPKELAFRLRITEKQCDKVISDLSSWVYLYASTVLADGKQDATLETEEEEEEEAKTEGETHSCSEPLSRSVPVPADPVIIEIPLVGSATFPVTEFLAAQFEKLYPRVDVPQTLREIAGWNMANPTRRKTRSGVMRHLNSWMAKEQNKGG